MFEEQILSGHVARSIRVDTHRGNPIKNVIEPDPGERGRRSYALIRKSFGQEWTNRKPSCGVYNCYGMVFASRRTAILDDEQIPGILKDDGYAEISEASARPGDLVVYRDRHLGLLHVAVICRRDEKLSTLFALSKWNSVAGEDEHHIHHHCWTDQDYAVELEFWTDRPV